MTFAEWFLAQHGPRGMYPGSDAELRDSANRGCCAGDELERRREWDAQRRSALMAWTARATEGQR